MILTQRNVVSFIFCLILTFIPKMNFRLYVFFLSVLDSKAASKAQTASPTRALSLDGALDSSELQSFAFQIANGMVKSIPVTVHLLYRSDLTLPTNKMPSRVDHEEMWIYHEIWRKTRSPLKYYYNKTRGTLENIRTNFPVTCVDLSTKIKLTHSCKQRAFFTIVFCCCLFVFLFVCFSVFFDLLVSPNERSLFLF